ISLGHNALFAIGAYTTAIATSWYGWGSVPATLLAIVVTCLVALVVGIPTLRLKGYYLAIATLGFAYIVTSLIKTQYFGGSSGITNIPRLTVVSYTFASDVSYYYLVWFVLFGAIVTGLRIGETALGRSMKAIHTDEDAAACMGIDVARTKIEAFVFSAAFAALAGALYAQYGGIISPTSFDIMLSVKLVLMLYLGGVGTVYGGVFGALLLFVLPEFLGRFEKFELMLEGLIFLFILMFAPRGLIGGLHYVRRAFFRQSIQWNVP
ncbi:MAG: branched-chain amino acid ABC transporter permease, partial [Deltaproteobacteria bacterium]|nr:branched-chain amino acid ABC transporter permease [Deltaproteobacteria bacterium]